MTQQANPNSKEAGNIVSYPPSEEKQKTPASCQSAPALRDGAVRLHGVSANDSIAKDKCLKALQEMLELKTALDQAALVLRTDARGTIAEANEKLCELFGYSPAELIGKKYSCLKGSSQPKHFFRQIWLTLKSGQVWKGEIKTRSKDGSDYWVEATIIPLVARAGKPDEYLAIGFDITERKVAEASLVEANRIKDEFLALVSHELRSPLSAILGWAQLALSRQLDEATTRRALHTIERNAKLQTQLIEDLQDLSRLIRGKLHLNARPVELVGLINAALDTVQPVAVAKGIQLEFVPDPGAMFVYGDVERLQQVIWKLLSNAIKFTAENGRVEVRLNRTPSHVLLHVMDTGCGLSPEFVPYVFEYFRLGDGVTAKAQNGLGLGLAIARHLVELHGGNIWASSPGSNQGATFTVQLPLLEVKNYRPKGIVDSGVRQESDPCDSSAIQGLQVLVVDDNQDAREFLLTALEAFGAKVKVAASVSEAMVEIEQERPDVLVSDIAMPGQDGYDLIRQVRTLERSHPGEFLPAVALTAFARKEDRAFALARGFQKYLSKPIEATDLVRTLAELAVSIPAKGRGADSVADSSVSETASYLPENWGLLVEEPELRDGDTLMPKDDAPLVLVVEDNGAVLSYLQSLLNHHYRVAVAGDGVEGLEKAKSLKPDLILSDQIMPRKNGLDLLREIRKIPELRLTPVIFLTARMGSQARIESFDAGADDYISKPFDEGELLARVKNLLRVRATEQQLATLNRQLEKQKQQLEKANQALQHRASFDSLTEVANRHYFSEYLNAEWRRLAREEAPLSLIMCDIDYFKLYNDTYGHQAGDECLRQVAAALRLAAKRSADLVARYGGEEFALILPNTDAEGATFVAEAIRQEVLKLKIEHKNSPVNPYVTLSVGVASWVPPPQAPPSTMIAAADEALYRAKDEGRDRVALAS